MRYYLGIDGGGTKTAYLMADENGTEVAALTQTGCSYREIGMEAVVQLFAEGIAKVAGEAGVRPNQIVCTVIGLPCYGESTKNDTKVVEAIERLFDGRKVIVVNDVKLGWAGSLGMMPGINIVAGTGSMAYGENGRGVSARSGGWSTFFGDEGSCYWLGRRTMELFYKEVDCREPRGKLYRVMMKYLDIQDPVEAIDLLEQNYIPFRDKVAFLQRILLQAANEGDEAAISLYREAAQELFLMIESVANALKLVEKPFVVSYSGGLFHAGRFVLPVLEEKVSKIGGCLKKPAFSPVQGAVLLARKSGI